MGVKVGFQHSATGATVYALVRHVSGGGEVYDQANDSFEDYATANLANYDVACTEEGTASRYYSCTLPMTGSTAWVTSNLDEQVLEVLFFVRAGGALAEGDTYIGRKEVVLRRDGIAFNQRSRMQAARE